MAIEYRSNNKCRLIVYAGSDAYGKTIRHIRTVTYTSKRNAEKQYREFEQEVVNELESKSSNVTISEMIDDYIASRERKGIRSTTLTGYRVIKDRVKNTLGDPVADKVTRKMIDDWIGVLDQEYKYSAKTIKNTVRFLSACYKRYIDLELLKRDPCRNAEIPNKPPKPRIILGREDIKPFYNALREETEDNLDFVVAVELMAFCGMRRSEVTGLKKSNIDLINGTVHIEDSRHYTGGQYVTGEGTKSRKSNRILALPLFLRRDILNLINYHEQRAAEDTHLPKPEYLILGAWGEPIYPGTLYYKLKEFVEKYDLPDINLHGLRHTYASMLKWFGRDLVEISNQLGHAQQSTTLNIYTHLFQEATAVSNSIANEINDFVVGLE